MKVSIRTEEIKVLGGLGSDFKSNSFKRVMSEFVKRPTTLFLYKFFE